MNKVVLITGTNSGFGKLTTKLLSDNGFKVYAGMRNTLSNNKDAANEINQWADVTVLDIDVTDANSITSAVNSVIETEGRLDILVNNAGVFTSGLTESFTDNDFENNLNVNVLGPWRMLRATLPQFRKQNDGLIVNISSGLGRFSAPFMTIYNSSKFALEGLIEGIHYELKGFGIEAVLIQPGAFPTDIFGKTKTGSDESIIESYGELAKIPQQIGENIGQLFASESAPNPQLVADAVHKLILTEKGKRPLRTVVDQITGSYIEKANAAVAVQHKEFLTAFGMGDLL